MLHPPVLGSAWHAPFLPLSDLPLSSDLFDSRFSPESLRLLRSTPAADPVLTKPSRCSVLVENPRAAACAAQHSFSTPSCLHTFPPPSPP